MNVNSGLLTLVQGGACGEEPWPVGGLGVYVCVCVGLGRGWVEEEPQGHKP